MRRIKKGGRGGEGGREGRRRLLPFFCFFAGQLPRQIARQYILPSIVRIHPRDRGKGEMTGPKRRESSPISNNSLNPNWLNPPLPSSIPHHKTGHAAKTQAEEAQRLLLPGNGRSVHGLDHARVWGRAADE